MFKAIPDSYMVIVYCYILNFMYVFNLSMELLKLYYPVLYYCTLFFMCKLCFFILIMGYKVLECNAMKW